MYIYYANVDNKFGCMFDLMTGGCTFSLFIRNTNLHGSQPGCLCLGGFFTTLSLPTLLKNMFKVRLGARASLWQTLFGSNSNEIATKFDPNLSLAFLIKGVLIKKAYNLHVYQGNNVRKDSSKKIQ